VQLSKPASLGATCAVRRLQLTAANLQVLKLVRKGSKARGILEFVEFMGTDAQKFALRCIRLMIAEVEIAKLKLKHGFALDAKV
jgi:hypothetical protein